MKRKNEGGDFDKDSVEDQLASKVETPGEFIEVKGYNDRIIIGADGVALEDKRAEMTDDQLKDSMTMS